MKNPVMAKLRCLFAALFCLVPALAWAQLGPAPGNITTPQATDLVPLYGRGTSGPLFGQVGQFPFGTVSTVPLTLSGVPAINITQNLAGNIPVGVPSEFCVTVCVNVLSDSMNGAAAFGTNSFQVNWNFGGGTGTRSGFLTELTQVSPMLNTTANSGLHFYVGMTPIVLTSGSGDGGTNTGAGALGGYYGSNPQVRTTATNTQFVIGTEDNIFGSSTATQSYQIGHSVLGLFVNHGATVDIGYSVAMSGNNDVYGSPAPPGPGWNCGFCALEATGFTPISSTGTFIGARLVNTSTVHLAIAIDLRLFTASTAYLIGPSFEIDNTGAAAFTSVSTTAGMISGIGATQGGININSGSNAYTTILSNNTVAYNFNLPATAGSFGQVLTSGGGGSAAMIWTSPFASPTFTGTVTGPDAATWTSSGFSALLAAGTIRSNTGFNINGAAGVSQTCTVNTASPLTLIFTNGILTGGTCNT